MIGLLLFWLALLTLVVWAYGAIEMTRGTRTIGFLGEVAPVNEAEAPRVSVVIAARDEERNIEEALRSVLGQQYPDLEVIVVDDRSTDATGQILDRMARESPRLRVVHVELLPEGWLGKNHALHRGAETAAGEWILFTDADVVMEPSTVARAIGYAVPRRVDHLAIAPELTMPGPLLDLFGGVFALFFSQFSKPWKARDPRSKHHIGIGAFNLLRTGAYRELGGHRPIALRPDDDIKLGKIVKQHGLHQDVLFGRGMLRVEWYRSLGEVVRGLEKNVFAGLGYSLAAVILSSLALLVLNVWPFAALFLTGGATWFLNLGVAALILALYASSTRASGSRPLYGLAFPLATLLFVFIVLRSTTLALVCGGIRWRGTFYPLDALRANRV